MAGDRTEKMQEALRKAAALFLAREANHQSLVTVTATSLSQDHKRGLIYITVFPDKAEEAALAFANRHRSEFSTFFKTQVRGMLPPHVEFVIDKGEKIRQRLDDITI